MDEFIIMDSVNKKKLNKNIQEFRAKNPNYDIYNISVAGTGGQMGGTIRFWVIWRLK